MMTTREQFPSAHWRAALLKAMAKRLTPFGYVWRKRWYDYYRQRPYGVDCVYFSFTMYATEMSATQSLAIGITKLEGLLDEVAPPAASRQGRPSTSFGIEIGNLTRGQPINIAIRSAEEVESAADELLRMYVEYGEPYLQKYSDLNVMLETLERDDRSGWMHSPLNDLRYCRAIGLAYLLKKYDKVEELIERGNQFLFREPPLHYNRFKAFAKRIRGLIATE